MSNSVKSEYLIRAYTQDHFPDPSDFLNYIEDEFGAGDLLGLHKFMCRKYGTPKIGTSRATYLSKHCVFKLPSSIEGFRLNDCEGSLCSIGKPGTSWFIPIALSRLIDVNDIPIVVIERVTEATLDDIATQLGYIPEFVSAVDMGQVGFTKKGELVAYDYADLF